MIILWRMFLSHLLADFTLQFDVVNRMKRKNVWGMLVHCFTHFFVSIALTSQFLNQTWVTIGHYPVSGWGSLVIMLVLHFVIDQLRVFGMKRMRFKDGTVSFLADQFLHLFVLFMVSPIDFPGGDSFLAEKWTAIACMFVLVTHVSTVLIYFVEKEIFGKDFPTFDEKYFLMFERLVLWAFFFVGGCWWLPVTALWLAQLFYVRKKRIIDLSTVNISLSLAITLALGLWTRYIYYGSLCW
ncbi:MAG: DUF3307 domain-containing protein [Elusimicrobiota bacterium]